MSSNPAISASLPTGTLETLASEQRQKIHESVAELRSRVREALDVRKQAREYIWPASAATAGLALLTGYGLASRIFRHRKHSIRKRA